MKRYQVVLATMALGAVVWGGQAMADGPGGEYGAETSRVRRRAGSWYRAWRPTDTDAALP